MRSYRFDKKSYMVQISVTLNVEMALILHYFTEFVYRCKTLTFAISSSDELCPRRLSGVAKLEKLVWVNMFLVRIL